MKKGAGDLKISSITPLLNPPFFSFLRDIKSKIMWHSLVKLMVWLFLLLVTLFVFLFTFGELTTLRLNKQSMATSHLRIYKQCLVKYFEDNAKYPNQEQGLSSLVNNGYISEPITDPWGKPYVYTLSQNTVSIASLGSDGKLGGVNEASDIKMEWNIYQKPSNPSVTR